VLEGGAGKGPIAKFVADDRLARLKALTGAEDGDAVFFVADQPEAAWKFAGQARTKVGQELGAIAEGEFAFCWIVDFPMFEYDDKAKKIDFSHNPFSMPQGGLEALETQDPLTIKAWQYDIVCNGIELCSGAIRNHKPEIMYKAFGIAGYSREEVEARFGGMLNAFKYGAPPHGGAAPGVDRIVMLLADEPNIREVITFPMNQQAVDLMMDAPTEVPAEKLRELHLAFDCRRRRRTRVASPRGRGPRPRPSTVRGLLTLCPIITFFQKSTNPGTPYPPKKSIPDGFVVVEKTILKRRRPSCAGVCLKRARTPIRALAAIFCPLIGTRFAVHRPDWNLARSLIHRPRARPGGILTVVPGRAWLTGRVWSPSGWTYRLDGRRRQYRAEPGWTSINKSLYFRKL
jgi:hypothetical protein